MSSLRRSRKRKYIIDLTGIPDEAEQPEKKRRRMQSKDREPTTEKAETHKGEESEAEDNRREMISSRDKPQLNILQSAAAKRLWTIGHAETT